MKRRDFLNEIKGQDKASLQAKAAQLAEELMRLRFKRAARQLEQSHRLTEARRALARVQTAIRQIENRA